MRRGISTPNVGSNNEYEMSTYWRAHGDCRGLDRHMGDAPNDANGPSDDPNDGNQTRERTGFGGYLGGLQPDESVVQNQRSTCKCTCECSTRRRTSTAVVSEENTALGYVSHVLLIYIIFTLFFEIN